MKLTLKVVHEFRHEARSYYFGDFKIINTNPIRQYRSDYYPAMEKPNIYISIRHGAIRVEYLNRSDLINHLNKI